MFGSRIFRVVLLFLVLGGLGWLIYRAYFYQLDTSLSKNGLDRYHAGVQALQGNDATGAVKLFHEARVQSDKLITRLEEKLNKEGLKLQPDDLENLKYYLSRAYYVRARTLRDLVYAQALADGRKLPEVPDSLTNESFRSYYYIPDHKMRQEATLALGAAAYNLPRLKESSDETTKKHMTEVLAEAIRSYNQFLESEPLWWEHIAGWASTMLLLNPKDVRSLYLMAKFHLDQPNNAGKALPIKDRSRDRMRNCLTFVGRLKELGPNVYPLWRTWHIEAQARYWLKNDALRAKRNKDFLLEVDNLKAMLFVEGGALDKIKAEEGLKRLSVPDAEGVLSMFPLAMSELLDEYRREEKETVALRIRHLLEDCLEFCKKMEERKDPAFNPEHLVALPVMLISKSQPLMTQLFPVEWDKLLKSTRDLVRASVQRKVGTPRTLALLADALYRESLRLPKGTPMEKEDRDALTKEALDWLDMGLALGQERKIPPAEMIDYHALAADMKFSFSKSREAIQSHLDVLRTKVDDDPEVRGLYCLLEGACYERESKLAKAREFLEKVGLPDSELQLRASVLLANIYLAMGQAEPAARYLRQLSKVYTQFESLSTKEKLWLEDYFGTKEDVDLVLVTAILETARQRVIRFHRDNPGLVFPFDIVEIEEREALRIIDGMPPQSRKRLSVRLALAKYYAQTRRMEKGRELLAELLMERPDSVQLLQTEVTFLVLDNQVAIRAGKKSTEELNKEIDQRIEKFLRDYPDDRTAKIYWTSWLSSTRRADEAVKYLQDPKNFAVDKGEDYFRVLYQAFIAKGDKEDAEKALMNLPNSPATLVALIELSETFERKGERILEAIGKHENKGFLRCYQGATFFHLGKHREAAESYLQALEFTLVRGLAQLGLQRALVAWAKKSPLEARAFLLEQLNNRPHEAALVLPFAFACYLLDEVGDPTDSWITTKNMGSALGFWDQIVDRDTVDRANVALTKAEYWFLAGRSDHGRVELLRAIRLAPRNTFPKFVFVDLVLNSQDRGANLIDARQFLEELKKYQPNLAATWSLDARMEERAGDPKKAVLKLETYLRRFPQDSFGYMRLIDLLLRQKEIDKANTWLRQWRERHVWDLIGASTEVEFMARDMKHDEARTLAQKQVDAFGKHSRERLFPGTLVTIKDIEARKDVVEKETRKLVKLEMAKALGRAGAWKQAQELAEEMISEDPDQSLPYLIIGDMHMAQGKLDQARAVYVRLWEKKKNAVAGNNLAWLLISHFNEPEEAYKVAKEIRTSPLTNKPLNGERLRADFLDTLGTIYERLKKQELMSEMRELFFGAKNRYGQDPRIYYYLAYACTQLQDRDASKYLEDAKSLLAANPNFLPGPQLDDLRKRLLRLESGDVGP